MNRREALFPFSWWKGVANAGWRQLQAGVAIKPQARMNESVEFGHSSTTLAHS